MVLVVCLQEGTAGAWGAVNLCALADKASVMYLKKNMLEELGQY